MPVTPTPTTPFSDKIHTLGRMLAAAEIFRTQSGLAADDPDAEANLLGEDSDVRRIYYPERDDEELLSLFPLAIIAPAAGRRYVAIGDGAGTTMVHDRGILLLAVLDEDRTPGDGPFNLEQSGRAFENFWGQVVDQLAAQSGRDWDPDDYPGETYSRLRIAAIEEIQPPQLSAREENTRYWAGLAHVYYGRWPELEGIRY